MDMLSRLGIRIEGNFADTLDGAIRDILKQFGLEEELEKVSGDNEKLKETAADYRQAARDLRGVVDDLEAERKKVLRKWDGEAAEAFKSRSLAFEQALTGEAEDMDTIATLLDEAAEACETAERLMMDLLVEIIESVLAMAATTAILSVITAGVGAVVGPLITAAGVAHRAMKAARITANLADKLSDLNRRLGLIRKAEKIPDGVKKVLGKGPDSYRKGLSRYLGRGKDENGNPLPGGNREDLQQYQVYREVKSTIKGEVAAPILGAEAGGTVEEAYKEYAPESYPGASPKESSAYDRRPPTQTFDDRIQGAESPTQKNQTGFRVIKHEAGQGISNEFFPEFALIYSRRTFPRGRGAARHGPTGRDATRVVFPLGQEAS